LRKAVAWLVDDGIFGNLPLHGNTKWQPCALGGARHDLQACSLPPSSR
jgi:hypothetical protein